MDTCRYLWPLALVVGMAGCGVETSPPAAGTTGAGTSPGPAVSKPASPTSAGRTAEPAPPVTKGAPSSPTPAQENSGKSEAPPLEGPGTGATEAARPAALSDAEIAKIKKLPPEEAEAALKQAVCPVSGDHLGQMGVPFKITAENRTFYLCCKGCVDDVKADPKSVIAKLDKK